MAENSGDFNAWIEQFWAEIESSMSYLVWQANFIYSQFVPDILCSAVVPIVWGKWMCPTQWRKFVLKKSHHFDSSKRKIVELAQQNRTLLCDSDLF